MGIINFCKNYISKEENITIMKEENKKDEDFGICIDSYTNKPIKIKFLSNEKINCKNLINLDVNSKIMINIFTLKDGRITACFTDGSIRIYDKYNYKLEASVYVHNNAISYHMQLSNGNIITCSKDNTIKIISLRDYSILQTLNHDDLVCQVLERNNNQIISTCINGYIYIWDKNDENKEYIFINKFLAYDEAYYINILLINNNEIVSLNKLEHVLKFWDLNNYNLIKSLENKEENSHIKSVYFEKSLNLLLSPNYYDNYIFETLIIIDSIKHEIIYEIDYSFINILNIFGNDDGKIILVCEANNHCISFNLGNKDCPFKFHEIITCNEFEHSFLYLNNRLSISHTPLVKYN